MTENMIGSMTDNVNILQVGHGTTPAGNVGTTWATGSGDISSGNNASESRVYGHWITFQCGKKK